MTRNDKNSQIVKYTGQIEARQLIFDLFARRAGREFDLPVLVHAGRPFGISEAAFRTALTRLKREGRVENLQRGRYRLKMPAALLQRILEWREVPKRRRPWAGAWVVAISTPSARVDRTIWRRSLRAFALEGLRNIDSDIFTRPDNLKGGASGVRARLGELGVPGSVLIGSLYDLDEDVTRRWIGSLNAKAIEAEHVRTTAQLTQSQRRLAQRSDEKAAAETLLLGRKAVRAILEDPLLPDELCSGAALQQLIDVMSEYDSFGRAIWDAYLQSVR
jgi:phenylacetic acid degradation operon negative regulatory protein